MLWLVLYAIGVSGIAALSTHPSTIIVDSNTYFAMAQQFDERRTLVIPNGLEVVDSPELWLGNTVKRGAHLVGKYPPLYVLIAAPAYDLFGLRGLHGLNAAALGLLVLGFYLLARQVLSPRAALLGAAALPLCVPLFPYGLIIMPHLLSAALLLWALVFLLRGQTAGALPLALSSCLLAGLLLGFSAGVRLQNILALFVFIAALGSGTRRILKLTAMAGGVSFWLVIISIFNLGRFGSWNPLSYGPAQQMGSPTEVETLAHFISTPSYLIIAAAGVVLMGCAIWYRRQRSRQRLKVFAAFATAILILVLASSHHTLGNMCRALWLLLVDSSLSLGDPSRWSLFHGWMRMSLLQLSPFLILGLGAVAVYTFREAPTVITAAARICLLLLAFLSLRHPEPTQGGSVLGLFWFGPRYLLEILPLLFLLTLYCLRRITPRRFSLWTGVALGGAVALGVFSLGPKLEHAWKPAVLLYAPLVAVVALGVSFLYRRRSTGALLLSILMFVTLAYGGAVTLSEQTKIVRQVSGGHARLLRTVAPLLPQRLILVGWGGAVHCLFPLREHRDVIFVDAAMDQGRDLQRVLHAFSREGWPIFHYGPKLQRTKQLVGQSLRSRGVHGRLHQLLLTPRGGRHSREEDSPRR